MPENSEEKKECLKKLNHMEKFLPFLDFMIDKIKKKSNEISLEYQLSKFQNLRSMIQNKSSKHNLDAITKVEEVIEKLILKLNYKEGSNELTKESTEFLNNPQHNQSFSKVSDLAENTSNTDSSVLTIPSLTTTSNSVKNASSLSHVICVDSRPQDSPTNDLLMPTIKQSVDIHPNNHRECRKEKEIMENIVGPNQSRDNSIKPMVSGKLETDLDKDLDGFDLTESSVLSEESFGNNGEKSAAVEVPKLIFSDPNVVSSSREKLIMALGKLFAPPVPNHASTRRAPTLNGEKKSDSQIISALNCSYKPVQSNDGTKKNETLNVDFSINVKKTFEGILSNNEEDNKSTSCEKTKIYFDKQKVTTNLLEKPVTMPLLSSKSLNSINYFNANESCSEFSNALHHNWHSKPSLKQRLTADIGEVYKISGKSVGGSLRSLKETKDSKKSGPFEKVEPFKAGKVTEININSFISNNITSKQKEAVNEKHAKTKIKDRLEEKFKKKELDNSNFVKNKLLNTEDAFKMKSLSLSSKEKKNKLNKQERQPDGSYQSSNLYNSKLINTQSVKETKFETKSVSYEDSLEVVKENMQTNFRVSALKSMESKNNAPVLHLEHGNLNKHRIEDVGDFDKAFTNNKIIDSLGLKENKKHIKHPEKERSSTENTGQSVSECNATKINFGDNVIKNVKITKLEDCNLPKNKIHNLAYKRNDQMNSNTQSVNESSNSILNSDNGVVKNLGNSIERDPRKIKNSFCVSLSNTNQTNSNENQIHINLSSNNSKKSSKNEYSISKSQFSNTNTGNHSLNLDGVPQNKSSIMNLSLPQNQRNTNELVNGLFAFDKNKLKVGNYEILNDTSRHSNYFHKSRQRSCLLSEAKSYAEYKRLKKMEKEKPNLLESYNKKEDKPNTTISTHLTNPSQLLSLEKKTSTLSNVSKNSKKFLLPYKTTNNNLDKSKITFKTKLKSLDVAESSGHKISGKGSGSSQNKNEIKTKDGNDVRKQKHAFSDCKKFENDCKTKNTNEKALTEDLEETVSPLESLYNDEISDRSKRRYRLQNFKIPKKASKEEKKIQDNSTLKEEISRKIKNLNEKNFFTDSLEKNEKEKAAKENVLPAKTVKVCAITKTNINPTEHTTNHNQKSSQVIESEKEKIPLENNSTNDTLTNIENNENQVSKEAELEVEYIMEIKSEKQDKQNDCTEKDQNVKITNSHMVSCDSSNTFVAKNADANVQSDSKPIKSNNDNVSGAKEEITQDLVESLIRKSFQSGEGKLLLDQAKLLEKLTRKLDSKKLKTIKKIINSESDEDSSSSLDIDFNEEKKKKVKKKLKKNRHLNLNLESLENDEDNCTKPVDNEKKTVLASHEEKEENKKTEENELNKMAEFKEKKELSDRIESKLSKKLKRKMSSTDAIKEKKSKTDITESMNNEVDLSIKSQKKPPEEFINEKVDQESKQNRNLDEVEHENKSKPKTKTKIKNELDRLHDDIRNTFICSEIITATGFRMCRMQKKTEKGTNNLDLVKEKEKLIEGEKLNVKEPKIRKSRKKKVQICENKNDGKIQDFMEKELGNDSGSAEEKSLLTIEKKESWFPGPKVKPENFYKQPCVLLYKLDPNFWFHNKRILDAEISQKSYTSLKLCEIMNENSTVKTDNNLNQKKDVFLARNIQKYEKMKQMKKRKKKECKTTLLGNIIKHLPLKTNRKQLCQKTLKNAVSVESETKTSKEVSLKKNVYYKGNNNTKTKIKHEDLLNYAFEKSKTKYPCKLCAIESKDIVKHYKYKHRKSEVLISRLNVEEALKAVADSIKRNYSKTLKQRASCLKMLKNRENHNYRKIYACRFCQWAGFSNFFLFFLHTTKHTGEYKYRCPMNGCKFTMTTKRAVKNHIQRFHKSEKFDLHSSVKSWCPVPDKFGTLFGYLCSKCHYVQIALVGLRAHVKNNHFSEKGVKIFKINMSSKVSKPAHFFKAEHSIEDAALGSLKPDISITSNENKIKSNIQNVAEVVSGSAVLPMAEENKKNGVNFDITDVLISNEIKTSTGNDSLGNQTFQNLEIIKNSSVQSPDSVIEVIQEDEPETISKIEMNEMPESVLLETCFGVVSAKENLKEIKGTEVEEPFGFEATKNKVKSACDKIIDPKLIRKLKVGPLEAQILNNSVILYECFVKGCLFSTKVFDLFEKHVKISHAKTKWNGICKVCYQKNGSQVHLTSYKLIYALNHLKRHEKDNESVTLKPLPSSTKKSNLDIKPESAFSPKTLETQDKPKEVNHKSVNESNYPRVPLLRVRNLVGDRLSTPKETPKASFLSNNVNNTFDRNRPNNNIPSAAVSLNEDPSAMFTIENVRSLKSSERLEESDLQVGEIIQSYAQEGEQPQEPKKLAAKPIPWSSKGVPIRPSPSRTIAIRPDCETLKVDVGQLNVVQAASVVLNSITNVTPVRKISPATTSSTTSKFTVQPVMVSVTPPFLSTSKTVSVMVPASSSTTTPAITPNVSDFITSGESHPQKCISEQGNQDVINDTLNNSSNSIFTPSPEISVSVSNSSEKNNKTITRRSRTKVYRSNQDGATSSSEVDNLDEFKQKSSNSFQKFSTSNLGNKSVKDSKIYQEMLTKTKLCHFFKCMAIECSFTCNKESVFTQHIGLHEAQRRMKNSKSWKSNSLESKLRKTLNWYQCAYCCEVLTSSSFALSRHIIKEHGHCIYQCAYCFYRAVSQCYVEIHQNMAHANILKTSSRVIYKCQPLSHPPPTTTALEKQGRRQNVRPYHCDQCGRKFFITQEFLNHLTTEHQAVTAYTCHICKNLCFKAERLINHYKLHSYCTYQCAYCLHGTETEKEMVFHLCNFHFSQPAYMYVRALADNQKLYNNQLDSLKVIFYKNDKLSPDCIVEADLDEESLEEISGTAESTDISAIAAELGISIEPVSSMDPICLLEDSSATNHAINSSSICSSQPENESSKKEVPVLLSLKNRYDRESIEDKDLSSVPLGQLSLEVLTANNKDEIPQIPKEPVPESSNSAFLDKNLKLNEIIMNLHHKEKPSSCCGSSENISNVFKEEKIVASAFHKMPPVVLSRKTSLKNVFPPKSPANISLTKKLDGSTDENNKTKEHTNEGSQLDSSYNCTVLEQNIANNLTATVKSDKSDCPSGLNSVENENSPIITNVISLNFTKNADLVKTQECKMFPIISEVTSLTPTTSSHQKNDVRKSEKNIQNLKCDDSSSKTLNSPVIHIDFPVKEKSKIVDFPPDTRNSINSQNETAELHMKTPLGSPEIVILNEKKTDDKVLTVTIDSEDEREFDKSEKICSTEIKDKESGVKGDGCHRSAAGDHIIRQEMEKLRNQIANETDCLLFDDIDPKAGPAPLLTDISTSVPEHMEALEKPSGLLSPIEEAISSLNKKLEEEGEKKKKEKLSEDCKKMEEIRTLPRTRSFTKERARKSEENIEKSDSDDSNMASNNSLFESNKKDLKVFKQGLIGKDLFICGNDKCQFAAEGDLQLKDHLYVCDFSRETNFLMCPHCFKSIRQLNAYIEHLKHHGEKKYECGLCSFASAVDTSVSRHVKQKHKCDQLKSVPADPPKEGFLIFYPKNHKLDKQDFESTGYSPGDEDKLPLQAVYQVNVKCAKCPYFTKVRSNMVRHLKIHVKSAETEGVVIVPSTAPTNPVPCLDTKEKMFDKMTNLAASSQLAQAKEKTAIEALAPEDEAKLPQFVTEQLRYKCCLSDCNYITVDEGMLKHHIKALHADLNCYSCPHCPEAVNLDVRNVSLDKIGYHLKLHDAKLYKCPHCFYIHYQKAVVEKHTLERHSERRYYVHTVREPKTEPVQSEDPPAPEVFSKVWKCGLCDDCQSFSKVIVSDHLAKIHSTKSKYKCKLCDMKSNHYHAFFSHFASRHAGEKVSYIRTIFQVCSNSSDISPTSADSGEHFDTTPLWQRGAPRIRHIRGILIEEEEVKTKKSKKPAEDGEGESESLPEVVTPGNSFYCPLCSDKKVFCTRNADFFRSHLYQELNYQQYACILCGKMFVDKKDYEKHHAKTHPDKPQVLKQTKEDGEIMFWVDKVIAKQKEEMESKKRQLSEEDLKNNQSSVKKKKSK